MIGDRVTVHLNGELVTDHVIMENYWDRNQPIFPLEQIELQAHGSKVAYRDIYTKDEYDNFVFRFEFQLTPGANNGLGIRTPMEGDAAYVGMERQIIDNDAPVYEKLQMYQYHGSVYGIIPAKRGYLKPVGEWNYEEVVANGDYTETLYETVSNAKTKTFQTKHLIFYMNNNHSYTKPQLLWLVALRVLIGWYFLYEGLAKVFTSGWTSYGYLMDSQGIFASFFKMIAQNQFVLPIIDAINVYGLIFIGLFLMVGCFTKVGHIGALILLSLYYLSHPPLLNVVYILRTEGSTLWVDKNLIMLGAVIVLMAFPTSRIIGLDRFILRNRKIK